MSITKVCSCCKETKPLTEFGPRKNGLQPYCYPCTRIKSREWYSHNKERARWKDIKRRYDLTQEEYQSLLTKQEGVCAICSKEASLVIDHCHERGVVRGLLCIACNSGLGGFYDDPDLLLGAADYLRRLT